MFSACADEHYPEQFLGISGIRTGLFPTGRLVVANPIWRAEDLEEMDVEQYMPVGP